MREGLSLRVLAGLVVENWQVHPSRDYFEISFQTTKYLAVNSDSKELLFKLLGPIKCF